MNVVWNVFNPLTAEQQQALLDHWTLRMLFILIVIQMRGWEVFMSVSVSYSKFTFHFHALWSIYFAAFDILRMKCDANQTSFFNSSLFLLRILLKLSKYLLHDAPYKMKFEVYFITNDAVMSPQRHSGTIRWSAQLTEGCWSILEAPRTQVSVGAHSACGQHAADGVNHAIKWKIDLLCCHRDKLQYSLPVGPPEETVRRGFNM